MSEKYSFPLIGAEIPQSDEYYRILFSGVEKKFQNSGPKSIAVTSAIKGEGKTTTTVQLAKVAVRDFGKKILLLEGDLRSPQLSSILMVSNKSQEGQAILRTTVPGLDVMTLSKIIKNKKVSGPAFATGLKKIIETVSSSYDYILVDCPPILPMVDMHIIAGIVDGIILVVRAEGPSRSMVNNALGSIPREKILGVVLNAVNSRWPNYGYGYGQY